MLLRKILGEYNEFQREGEVKKDEIQGRINSFDDAF
jgi:hypothetical protein